MGNKLDGKVYTKFNKPLDIGDFITYDIEYGQIFKVSDIIPNSARGYEIDTYELELVTADKSEKPNTEPFIVGTQWSKVLSSACENKTGSFKIVSKRKRKYDGKCNKDRGVK